VLGAYLFIAAAIGIAGADFASTKVSISHLPHFAD
jgi:nitrate/nitrite transporter NarK